MLSICIPAHTYVDYTAEAVSQLLKEQEDFEVIVVEDFDLLDTTPETRRRVEYARSILASDSRVVWHRSDVRRPIQENWNFTVSLANREYVKLMGADDRVCPGGIGKIHEMIRAEPAARFHGHLARVIDEKGRVIRVQRPYARSRHSICIGGSDALRSKLRQIARFKEPACNVYAKETWQSVGGYSARYRFCFDIEFNVNVMRQNACCLWNEYVVELRRHAGSDGATLPADLALDDLRGLVNDIYVHLGNALTPADRASGEAWVGYRTLELGIARYRSDPLRLFSFLRANFGKSSLDAPVLLRLCGMLARRVCFQDVQRTLK